MADSFAGEPRATVRRMDATAIDAPDGAFDLALFALSFHHLPRQRPHGFSARAPGSRRSC